MNLAELAGYPSKKREHLNQSQPNRGPPVSPCTAMKNALESLLDYIYVLAQFLNARYTGPVAHHVSVLSWVDFDSMFHSSCPTDLPILPISHQPKQNQADSGTAKIKVNPTQARDVIGHPPFMRIHISIQIGCEIAISHNLAHDSENNCPHSGYVTGTEPSQNALPTSEPRPHRIFWAKICCEWIGSTMLFVSAESKAIKERGQTPPWTCGDRDH